MVAHLELFNEDARAFEDLPRMSHSCDFDNDTAGHGRWQHHDRMYWKQCGVMLAGGGKAIR